MDCTSCKYKIVNEFIEGGPATCCGHHNPGAIIVDTDGQPIQNIGCPLENKIGMSYIITENSEQGQKELKERGRNIFCTAHNCIGLTTFTPTSNNSELKYETDEATTATSEER